jgi:hypothetical protein
MISRKWSFVAAMLVAGVGRHDAHALPDAKEEWVELLAAQRAAIATVTASVRTEETWNVAFRGRLGTGFDELLGAMPRVKRGTWTRASDMVRLDLKVDNGSGDATVEAWDGMAGTRIVDRSKHVFIDDESPLLGKPRPCFLLGQVVDAPLPAFFEAASEFRVASDGDGAAVQLNAKSDIYDATVRVHLRPTVVLDAVDVRGAASGKLIEQCRWSEPVELSAGVSMPTRCELVLYRDLNAERVWLQRIITTVSDMEVNVPIPEAYFRPETPAGYTVYDRRTLRLTAGTAPPLPDAEHPEIRETAPTPDTPDVGENVRGLRPPSNPAEASGAWTRYLWFGIGILLLGLACLVGIMTVRGRR